MIVTLPPGTSATALDTPPTVKQAAPSAPTAGVHTAVGTEMAGTGTSGKDTSDSDAWGSSTTAGCRATDTQCTPWPVAKKKFTIAGPAPINRAANPETSTAFRPL